MLKLYYYSIKVGVSASGKGGSVDINAGSTSSKYGVGGSLNIVGGSSKFATGGDVNIRAGSGAKGSGVVNIISVHKNSTSGAVNIASENSLREGDSGNVTISTGSYE